MNLSLLARAGIFGGMVIVTVLCCFAFSNPPTNPAAGIVVWLPDDISGMRADEVTMGPAEKKWLPKDTTYLSYRYLEEGLPKQLAAYRALKATLIVAGSDSRSLHRPQVCLTAQGWEIEKAVVEKIDVATGSLEVMDYHLTRVLKNKDGSVLRNEAGDEVRQRAHYVYWWVGPEMSTAFDKEQVIYSVINSIVKGQKERWAYPSVLAWVDERKGEEGVTEARKRVFDFVKEYAPKFQKSLGAKDRPGARPLTELANR